MTQLNIKDELKKKITLTTLAQELGVSLSTISYTLSGRTNSFRVASAIAARLDRPVHEVFPNARERIPKMGTIKSVIDPQEVNQLRKDCKKLMIDLDLDRLGSYDIILPRLNEAMGKTISKASLSMALTGYRSTEPYFHLLQALESLLKTWPHGEHSL